jgi:hypothetical protein
MAAGMSIAAAITATVAGTGTVAGSTGVAATAIIVLLIADGLMGGAASMAPAAGSEAAPSAAEPAGMSREECGRISSLKMGEQT